MKTRLPSIRIEPEGAGRREALAAWLGEWEIDRALAPAAPSEAVDAGRAPRPGRRRKAREGEVRLLPPDTPRTRERPRYVVVLSVDADAASARVAPFSRFASPAVPGEWRTGHPGPPLAVLCLWNARDLPVNRVERAWPVTLLGAERLAVARRIDAEPPGPDTDPPPALAADVGPPLRAPDDPRWSYLAEEAQAWDEIAAAAGTSGTIPWVLCDGDRATGTAAPPLPLAAEPPPDYGNDRGKRRRPPGREGG